VIAEGGYYGMQTFDQHLLQHLEAGRITMEEAVHVATSPHDFKLMVAAGGKPKGEGQAMHPGAAGQKTVETDSAGMPGFATVALPEPVVPSPSAPPVPAPSAPPVTQAPAAPPAPGPAPGYAPAAPPSSAPPPGF
jgi:twitching motility protein PilT